MTIRKFPRIPVFTLWVLAAVMAGMGAAAAQSETRQDSPQSSAQNTKQNLMAASAAADASAAVEQDQSARPALQERHPRYRIMRQDVLSLSFPLSPEFNRQVTVQPDGYINLQSAGSLYVQGMTVPEVVAALKQAYAKVLHEPIIDVDLVDFQKPFFIAGGQVGKPGQYELRHDTTVAQAVAISGGLLSSAKTQVFLFHRVSNDMVEVKRLDLKDIYHGKSANEDAELRPGDMIYVPEKFISSFRKYVPYSIGSYIDPRTILGR